MMKTYEALWGKSLRWSSSILVVLTLVVVIGAEFLPDEMPGWSLQLTRWLLPVIVLACVPFVVRGYGITEDAILIRRLFSTTRLERAGLKSVEVLPNAMRGSLRTCGNGGGFSFTGWWWSRSLGSYRAYVTDLNRTVVLRFQKRTVVLSPASPEDFVNDLQC